MKRYHVNQTITHITIVLAEQLTFYQFNLISGVVHCQ